MSSRRILIAAAVIGVMGVAVFRVAATHRTESATADEPHHIASGIGWLGGRYDLWRGERQWHIIGNAPLARIAVGLGPYLAGVRDLRLKDVLYDGPGYEANLVSARRGVLPFLVLLIGLTWWTTRRLFGDVAGVLSAAAVSTLPVILGHAGLATTDVAGAATYLLAVLLLMRWLEAPSAGRAIAFGAAFGLALVTKMSILTLVPAALVVILHRRVTTRAPLAPRRALVGQAAALLAAAVLVSWAAYRFSFGRPDALADPATVDHLIGMCAQGVTTQRLWRTALHVRMPAPEIADGLLVLCAFNGPGVNTSYLLGRITQDGFALYFPVALLVKTPLPFLILMVMGIRAAVRDAAPERWRRLAPALIALVVLISVLPSRLNIGVRHVMQLFPLAALYVGPGLISLWRASRRALGRALAVGLGAWQLIIPFAAAPAYLSWFSFVAGPHPENVLLDSDLDWGQDLGRLERILAERHVRKMSIAFFGPSDLCRHDLPPGRWLRPYERATGTVVISEMYLKGVASPYYFDGNYCDRSQLSPMSRPDYDQFKWLKAYTPVARAGASILIYDIPADAPGTRGGP